MINTKQYLATVSSLSKKSPSTIEISSIMRWWHFLHCWATCVRDASCIHCSKLPWPDPIPAATNNALSIPAATNNALSIPAATNNALSIPAATNNALSIPAATNNELSVFTPGYPGLTRYLHQQTTHCQYLL